MDLRRGRVSLVGANLTGTATELKNIYVFFHPKPEPKDAIKV